MSKRTLIAFIGAPLLPALIPTVSVYVNRTSEPLTMFVFFSLVSYVMQTVIGVPVHLLLGRNKMHRLWVYVLLGFFGGLLPPLLLALRKHTELGYGLSDYLVVIYPSSLGAGVGLVFWLLARPDKSAQPNSN